MKNFKNIRNIRIGFIGAGRVGYALSTQLHKNGAAIVFIVDSDVEKARRCGEVCGARETAVSLELVDEKADAIIIAVPDDVIPTIVQDLATYRLVSERTVIAHTSGLKTSDALGSLRSCGAHVCSCHPAFSFPEKFDSRLKEIPFAVEGDSEACQTMKHLIEEMGGKTVPILKKDKVKYHLGCTMVSNCLIALTGAVDSMFKDIKGVESVKYVLPLIRATLMNIETLGPIEALTGPIVRGDVHTVETHLDLLLHSDEEALQAYVSLGRLTLRLAEQAGLVKEKKRNH